MIFSVLYAQDRSLIFTTGAPLGSCIPSNNPCNTDGDCLLGETCDPPGSHIIEYNCNIIDKPTRFWTNLTACLDLDYDDFCIRF